MSVEMDGRKRRYEHRRDELLAAVTEYALEHGVVDLTLRSAATAVGVSHATLVHHFTTRDALVAEIVDRVLARALVQPVDDSQSDWLSATWAYLVSDEGLRYGRLFIAITGLSLYGDPVFADALRRSVRERVGALAEGYLLLGCPPEEALATATSLISRLRGLVTDLLITGDLERIEGAVALLRRDSARRLAEWTTARPVPSMEGTGR